MSIKVASSCIKDKSPTIAATLALSPSDIVFPASPSIWGAFWACILSNINFIFALDVILSSNLIPKAAPNALIPSPVCLHTLTPSFWIVPTKSLNSVFALSMSLLIALKPFRTPS